GCSKRSAGPPAFTVRSTISVISRLGSTSGDTRTSSPSRSSSAIHSRRSRGGAKAASVYGVERLLNCVVRRQVQAFLPCLRKVSLAELSLDGGQRLFLDPCDPGHRTALDSPLGFRAGKKPRRHYRLPP